jgi:hypothetical protein
LGTRGGREPRVNLVWMRGFEPTRMADETGIEKVQRVRIRNHLARERDLEKTTTERASGLESMTGIDLPLPMSKT